MSTNKLNSKTSLFVFAVIFAMTSCGSSKKVAFEPSTVNPSAEGRIKAKKDKNNNYALDISVVNLSDPQRLSPPRKSYVVWMETENGTKNIGQVNSSKGMFSKTRKASLTTVSNVKPIRIFVTAEDDPKIEYPGTQTVLTTRSF